MDFKNRRRPRSGGFQPPTDATIFIFNLRAHADGDVGAPRLLVRLPSIAWISKIAEGQGASVSNRRQMLRSSSFTFEFNLDAFEYRSGSCRRGRRRSQAPRPSSVHCMAFKNRRRPRSVGFQPPTDATIFIFHVRAQPRRRRIPCRVHADGDVGAPRLLVCLPSITWLSKIAEGQGAAVSNRRQMLRSLSFTFELNLDAVAYRAELMPTGTSALPGSSSVFRQLHGFQKSPKAKERRFPTADRCYDIHL